MFTDFLRKSFLPSSIQREDEEAFTLLELIIAVIVISILASVSLLVAGEQQKQAVISTVKSDTYSNKDVMAPGSGQKLYSSPELFAKSANNTGENVTRYVVSPNQTEACTETTRTFSDSEVVVYRFWTKVGRLEALPCPDLEGGTSIETGGGETTPTPTPTPGGGGVGGGEVVPDPDPTDGGEVDNGDGGYGTDPIRPGNSVTTIEVIMTSNETYRVCYNVRANTTSTTGAPWAVTIDKTVAPFAFGNFIEGLNDSRYHITDQGSTYSLYGSQQMQNASTSQTISPNFCVKAPNNLPVIPTKTVSNLAATGSASGNMYSGTQNFTVRNSSQYYTGWSVEVDLTDLKNTVSGKPNDPFRVDTDVSIERVSGNIYRVSSSTMYRAIKDGNNYTFTVRLG